MFETFNVLFVRTFETSCRNFRFSYRYVIGDYNKHCSVLSPEGGKHPPNPSRV